MAAMELSLDNVLLHVKDVKLEQMLDLAKKLAIPASLFGILLVLFNRGGKRISKKDLKVKKPIQAKECFGDENYEYELKNITSLKLYGWTLRLANRLAPTTFGQLFLVPIFKKKSNLDLLKHLYLSEKPTLYPLVPSKIKAVDHNNGQCDIDIWKLIQPRETSSDTFRFNTISDYVQAYRSGLCTPTDVAHRALAAMQTCEDLTPKMRIFVQTNSEAVLEMAQASTQRYKENALLSIFDGIPVSAKDEFKVAGFPCHSGTSFLGEVIETEESESFLLSKLRKGGAVILGVTNMQQLGIGTTGCNGSRLHGTARNPYNPGHYCGGSSSGSGGAVAAGLGPMSVGVDGGGSTRIPAAACGVVGVKGTFGRMSSGNVFQFSDTVGHPGPLCPTVRDAAISYAFLAGPDPNFQPSLEQPPVSLENFENTNLEGIKIGIDWTYFKHGDAEVVEACMQAIEFLEKQCKAEIVNINIPELEEARLSHLLSITTEMCSYSTIMRAENFDELNLDCQLVLTTALSSSAEDYHMAQKQRTRSMLAFEYIFKKVDCVITPTMPITMPKVDTGALKTGLLDGALTGLTMRYMFIGNLIGIPCISIPIGYGENNMPIGLQVMTNWWDEAMMFRVAHAAEGALKVKNKPQVYFDLL